MAEEWSFSRIQIFVLESFYSQAWKAVVGLNLVNKSDPAKDSLPLKFRAVCLDDIYTQERS
jgi:hypothetical protein